VIQLTERYDLREKHAPLMDEVKDLDTRIARLVVAVEAAGDVVSLVDKLRQLEARRKAIDREMIGLHLLPRLVPAVVEGRLAEWRGLLRGSTLQGSAVLQRILRSRIVQLLTATTTSVRRRGSTNCSRE